LIKKEAAPGSTVDNVSADDYADYGFIKYKNKLAKKEPEPVAVPGSTVDNVSADDYADYGFIKYKNKLTKE
jgi:hypothetical protein